jgi:hypothetical protein
MIERPLDLYQRIRAGFGESDLFPIKDLPITGNLELYSSAVIIDKGLHLEFLQPPLDRDRSLTFALRRGRG